MNPVDLLGRELHIDDYVVFTNCLYQVVGVGTSRNGSGPVRIMLVNRSKTTRSVIKYSQYMCKVPREDVLALIEESNETVSYT